MELLQIARDLGVFAIALAAIGWVAREVATRWLDNRVEVFREQLRRESTEHQIRFESLHQRRAKAIYRIWLALKEARRAVDAFVNPIQIGEDTEQENRGISAGEATRVLRGLVFRNSILFPKPLADRVIELSSDIDSLQFRAFRAYRRARKEGACPYDGDGAFASAWDKLTAGTDPVLLDLETEFRRLLGV